MLALFLAVFFAMAGFSILLPSILFVLQNLGAEPSTATLSLAAYSFSAFLVGPRLGKLSDRVGRKKVLLVTYAAAASAYGLLAQFGTSIGLIILFMAVAGAMSGNMAVVFAAVADRFPKESRAKGMGLVGAAIGLAFTLGPGFGGYLGGATSGAARLAAPAFASSISLFLAFSVILILFRSLPDPEKREESSDHRDLTTLADLAGGTFGRNVLLLASVAGAFTLALSLMEPTLPLFLAAEYDWGPREVGRLFLLVGLVLILVQGVLVGRLARMLGEVPTALTGMVAMAAGLAALATSGSEQVVPYAVALVAVGSGLATASLAALTSQQVGPDQQGAAMGGFQSAQALARSIGPVAAGLLIDQDARLPFWGGVAVTVLATLAIVSVVRALKKTNQSVSES